MAVARKLGSMNDSCNEVMEYEWQLQGSWGMGSMNGICKDIGEYEWQLQARWKKVKRSRSRSLLCPAQIHWSHSYAQHRSTGLSLWMSLATDHDKSIRGVARNGIWRGF